MIKQNNTYHCQSKRPFQILGKRLKQVPSVHRLKLGKFEVSSLLDGYLDIDPRFSPARIAVRSAAPARNGTSPFGPVRTVTAFAVNTGKRLVKARHAARIGEYQLDRIGNPHRTLLLSSPPKCSLRMPCDSEISMTNSSPNPGLKRLLRPSIIHPLHNWR